MRFEAVRTAFLENFSCRNEPGAARSCYLFAVPWAASWTGGEFMRVIAAAVLYFAIVFGAGFMLGPVRVFWLEPRLGETLAVLCEAPFILLAIVLAARWVPKELGLKKDLLHLTLTGAGALILQQLADFATGIFLRGMTATQLLAHFASPAGLIYAALLILFLAMPVLENSAAASRTASYSKRGWRRWRQ